MTRPPTKDLKTIGEEIARYLRILGDTIFDEAAPPKRRKRGRTMSRRRGQSGSISVSGKWWRVRFWLDVPGRVDRVYMSKKLCPVKGPGLLSPSARRRRAKEIIEEIGADKEETLQKSVASVLGVTFRQQAEKWLATMKKRGRAPATLETWEQTVSNWLNPAIGELPLDSIKKTVSQGLIDKMIAGGLSPTTVRDYFSVVKMVMSSVTNEDGEQLFPRNWKAMGLVFPKIIAKNRRRPIFLKETMDILATSPNVKPMMQMLFILCGASGLRIGEALGLRIEKVKDDGTRLIIDSKLWKNEEHNFLKTANAEREIDLHSSVAKLLTEYIGTRTSGLVFRTSTGKPLAQSFVLSYLHRMLAAIGEPKAGPHAFRRWRNTYLRNFTSCPESVYKFWLGHSPEGMSELYDRIKTDVHFRKEVAQTCGVGFTMPPHLNPIAPKIGAAKKEVEVVSV